MFYSKRLIIKIAALSFTLINFVNAGDDALDMETHKLGSELYHDYCSVCHGDTGNGAVWAKSGLNPHPRNFTTQESKDELNRKRMIFSVTYGRPETAMQGWGKRLRPFEIEAIVDYVRLDFMSITKTAEPKEDHSKMAKGGHDHSQHFGEDIDAPVPNGLVGNLKDGEKLYTDNCVACHDDDGDGRGPRSRFIFPKPRNLTHPAAQAKYSRPHLFEVIRTGMLRTEMPAWGTVLSEQEIADISEYVFQSFIRPTKATSVVNEHAGH